MNPILFPKKRDGSLHRRAASFNAAAILIPLLIIIFWLMRLGSVLTAVEAFSYSEEPFHGVMVKEFADGLKLPIFDYQVDVYSGGSLLEAALGVPFFKMLGPNLFALKMVPLLFSFCTMLLLFFFVRRYWGPKNAIAALLFYVFAPPVFVQVSLCAVGYHSESLLFSLGMFSALYAFLFESGRRRFFLILFGLLGGLAFSFHYITIIPLVTCLVSWYLLDRRSFLSRNFFLMLLGLALGLLPFLIYNADRGAVGFRYLISTVLTREKISQPPLETLYFFGVKFLRLLLEGIPRSFFSLPLLGSLRPEILSYPYAVLAFSLIGCGAAKLIQNALRRNPLQAEEAKRVPLLVYFPLFTLIYTLSEVPVPIPIVFMDSRYFVSLHLVTFILVSSLLKTVRQWILAAGLIVLGFLGQTTLFFREPFGRAFQYLGYSYHVLPYAWSRWTLISEQEFLRLAPVGEKLEEKDRRFFYWGLSTIFQFEENTNGFISPFLFPPPRFRPSRSLAGEEAQPRLQASGFSAAQEKGSAPNFGEREGGIPYEIPFSRLPEAYHSYFYQAFGFFVPCDPLVQDGCLERTLETIPRKFHPYVYAGAASGRFYEEPPQLSEEIRIASAKGGIYRDWFFLQLGGFLYGYRPEWGFIKQVGSKPRKWLMRGLGQSLAEEWVFEQKELSSLWQKIPSDLKPADRREIYRGIGWGIRDALNEDSLRAEHWLRRLPLEDQKYALEGMKAFEKWYQIS